jgi:hypothetical protein
MKQHRYFQAASITFALIFANNAPAYCRPSQNNPASQSQIQIVKDQVQKIGEGEDVTVILVSGMEYYGAISKIEPDSFEIAEVDLKKMVTIAYTDVIKVEMGYGPMNSSTGRRQKPYGQRPFKSRGIWIFMAVSAGAMIGLMVVAVKTLGKHKPIATPFPRIP